MKVAVITNCNVLDRTNLGVFKKIYGQIKAFLSYGFDANFFYKKSYILVKEDINIRKVSYMRPNCTEEMYNYILKNIKDIKYDLIYIRYPMSDYFFLSFLRNIKLINNNIKVILDFPTYPYDKEIINDKRMLNIDIYFRKLLNEFVDMGICYNNVNYIYDIPVCNIGNGIDVKNINKKNNIRKITDKEINLIAVANISFWHGYDRLIKGLAEYYKKEHIYKIKFNIIGDGNEIRTLMDIVENENSNTYVKFLGVKKGKELDEIFNSCDIGVGSLGMYRKGLIDGSELKNREYCSRGLPFIFAYDDKDFQQNFKYCMKVNNDNSNIDINSIIEFYEDLKTDNNVIDNMRRYAEENLTWEKKMMSILE
ncbi:glycosyltransferase [Clostridium botulinum]|uniref:glycosyltransferase n=1 Tax=Clostridium botulinum TaxID=1491 RepID=UPI003DA1E86E